MKKTIQITVDEDTAAIYGNASQQDQLKISILLGMWLREMRVSDPSVLDRIMDRISRNAQEQGLTPEILQSLLADDD